MLRHFPDLGFAVLVLGQPGLKSNDTRRWQKNPHLLTSIGYLDAIFLVPGKAEDHDVPDVVGRGPVRDPPGHAAVSQSGGRGEDGVDGAGAAGAGTMGLRLSFHPSQYTILNSPDPELNRKSVLDVESQSTILDIDGGRAGGLRGGPRRRGVRRQGVGDGSLDAKLPEPAGGFQAAAGAGERRHLLQRRRGAGTALPDGGGLRVRLAPFLPATIPSGWRSAKPPRSF